ncbi:unnamed protein product [Vitrella brassicaformis CCMP3155]|uniref:Uncharacterized protein n=1 Tax=Vitrella brassicaformis (strain CCMP3155) TaxID=1169540 RepID=A0A0G4G402_VITBC|nr:unnamed protein product [Vitrella brassicaformis CCMP3155]|eukprot:CEM22945.1 unnamed protein product [Vitrella brassicaformis CCMP3155]
MKGGAALQLGRLGNQLYNQGQFPEAHNTYQDALQRLPTTDTANRAVILANKGACLMHQGHLSVALDDFSAALEANPKLVKAWARKATVLIRQKKYPVAVTTLQDGLKALPENKQLYAFYLRPRSSYNWVRYGALRRRCISQKAL